MFLRFRVCLVLFGLLPGFALLESRGVWARNVSYDGRALIIDGHHRILFSGAIHYPRSPPQMWPSLISKARAGGLEVIETYVFWNLHEPRPGKYNFRGGRNIVRFIKEIQAQGLYACLRIGPFIEAEWTYGGLPFWLHDVPGIVFRSDNEPFKHYMKRFVKKIVKMMKAEKLYASQGGPIILSQIENEYGMVEAAFKEKGPIYVKWAAKMAVKLNTGVPWVMCKQNDAPDPVINACNGRKCGETFAGPNSPNKPAIWTENWTSFLQAYGEEPPIRSAEDIAFQVALFIAKNGSFINYYMYHGGTNFGRTGAAYMLTSYYDQAPLDEYGLLREPKWGHLKELHAAIKLSLKPLLSGVYVTESLGESQEAFVFRGSTVNNCAAFLVNNDTRKNVTVHFRDSLYDLPPKSISILPNCKTVAFNTAQVGTQYSTRGVETSIKLDSVDKWKVFSEAVPTYAHTSLRAKMLLEHMNTTKDKSDYLWYTFRFMHDTSDQFVLDVSSFGHVVHAFVNGAFVGSAHGSRNNKSVNLQQVVSLNKGRNHVSLLSVMVGLPDSGAFLERRVAGLTGVRIQSESESRDFTNHSWGYQVGLLGEKRKIYTKHGAAKVNWRRYGSSTLKPLTWYKTLFDAPAGKDPVALNMESMGKGEVWVNGHSIGRYWVSFHTQKGTPSQTWYNIPRAYLKHSNNRLVILEEEKAYPLGVSVDTISITRVCGRVLDSYLPPVVSWHGQSWKQHEHGHQAHSHKAKMQLHCPQGKHISTILFASYGTPVGDCQSYAIGSCHSPNSLTVVEKACLGKKGCSIHLRSWKFGGDPCPGTPKTLLVDARCSLLLSN